MGPDGARAYLLTLGFGLSLNPDVRALPAYLLLGAIVGLMVVSGRRLHLMGAVLPVVAAFTVTAPVAFVLDDAVGADPFLLLAPPLVSFLPGLTMTIAAVEPTSDEVVAGASRIFYGIAQLALLGFGVYAAFAIVGEIPPGGPVEGFGEWAPWGGVLLTAVGYVLFSSVPRSAFLWLLACLCVTVAAQRLGNVMLSPELSGFVGAFVVVSFTSAVSRWKSSPPAIVMMIPAGLVARAGGSRLHRHQPGRKSHLRRVGSVVRHHARPALDLPRHPRRHRRQPQRRRPAAHLAGRRLARGR